MKDNYNAPSGFNPNPFVKELYHSPEAEYIGTDALIENWAA